MRCKGHEDIDQYFSQQGALLSRNTFDSADDVVNLMDSSYRPESLSDQQRKQQKEIRVCSQAYKLDTVAKWKPWVAVLGVRLLGLRSLI